jgi:Glycosyl hydrolase catalytic core
VARHGCWISSGPAQTRVQSTSLLSVRTTILPYVVISNSLPTSQDWYGVNASEFEAYIKDFHNTFLRPLWVTEWACQNYVDFNKQCSPADVVSFMKETQNFMDVTDWVERYAWFGAMKSLRGVNSVRVSVLSPSQ